MSRKRTFSGQEDGQSRDPQTGEKHHGGVLVCPAGRTSKSLSTSRHRFPLYGVGSGLGHSAGEPQTGWDRCTQRGSGKAPWKKGQLSGEVKGEWNLVGLGWRERCVPDRGKPRAKEGRKGTWRIRGPEITSLQPEGRVHRGRGARASMLESPPPRPHTQGSSELPRRASASPFAGRRHELVGALKPLKIVHPPPRLPHARPALQENCSQDTRSRV